MKNSSILIVDDNPADIILTGKVITKSRPGTVIEHACNGVEALARLKDGSLPALIFLDYKMPGLDGIDVLNNIRQHTETRYLPVVVLTASTCNSDIKNAFEAGANSYLHKTHNLETFMREIEAALHYWLDLNLSPNIAL